MSDNKKTNVKKNVFNQIFIAVVVALLIGGSAPWWWQALFGERPVHTGPPTVREVVLDTEQITILVGDEHSILATPRDAYGDLVRTARIKWTSSNKLVAVVDREGTIKGISEGVTHISAFCDGYVAKIKVTVQLRPRCAIVKITKRIETLALGDRHQLGVELFDSNGVRLMGGDVTWTSTAPGIAGVDHEGHITAFKVGSVEIKATCDDGSEGLSLTVFRPDVSSVEISGEASRVVTEGCKIPLDASVLLSHGKYARDRVVRWDSSNPSIAQVDQSGNVIARSAGSVTISAECEGKSDQVTVQIRAAVRRVAIVSNVTEMYPNYPTQLKAKVFDRSDNELSGRTIIWSVNDEGLATVDAEGTLITRRVGYVVVTAESEGVKDTHEISVVPKPPPMVKKVTVNAGDNNIWILTFDQMGRLTSWIQRDIFGFSRLDLNGSGSASPLKDARFAWEIDAQGSMMGLVPLSFKFLVTRSGEVYMNLPGFGLQSVGVQEAEFWE